MTEILMHYLRHASSFAATWLSCWFLLYLVLWCLYPAVRRFLFNLHPATASNALLALLALPFLTSLVATGLVFTPILEKNLITDHYHSPDCEDRFPLLKSGLAIGGVLIATAGILFAALGKFFSQLFYSLRLEAKLALLGERKGEWHVLPHREKLVFTMGWLKNSIFITEGLRKDCSAEDLAIILEHEEEHARRRDNLRLLAGRLLLLIMPGSLGRKPNDDLQLFGEAACDFATARKHGALNVAETLLRIQRLAPRRFNRFSRTMVAAFTGSEVENRVLLLLEGKPGARAGKFRPLVYLALLLALSVLLVDPLHHGVEWILE